MAFTDIPTQAAVELKGRMVTVTLLRLLSPDPEAIAATLDQRLAEAPDLLVGTPVVLDLGALREGLPDPGGVVAALRARGLEPLAVRRGGRQEARAAEAAGLPLMAVASDPSKGRSRREAARAARAAARVVDQPVRSGQQVYARDGDLVVLGSVSPGAEILADGHIHVYGTLRGRALAGVRGDTAARIFCGRLEAELLSICGCYRISEDIGDAERGRPARVRLDGEALRIEPLWEG